MSTWQPKPGELFIGAGATTYYAVEVTTNSRTAWRDGFHAIRADGNGYPVAAIADARPLLVIDPEDREQVEQLAEAVEVCGDSANHCEQFPCASLSCWGDRVQAALRSMLTPPKPEEPTGLGAVVEDGDGTKWIRHDSTPIHKPWNNTDDCTERYALYADVPAPVRILSAGVTDAD